MPFRRMMVGLTRTPADAGLIEYAAGIARLGTIEDVRFVHVLFGSDDSAPAKERDAARTELEAIVAASFVKMPVSHSSEVLTGPLMDRLLGHVAEQKADVLLVGHRHDHPGRRALARRLAMKAPCSVWMAPEGSSTTMSRIIVPIDFSEHAADTMRVAVGLARLTGAECYAVHVYFDHSVARYEGYDQVLRDRAGRTFDKFVAPIDCQGVRVTPLFEESPNVANAIIRVAERESADVIVIGTRGRSRSTSILLGSVTEEVMIATKIPLLAVKHFGAQLGLLQYLLRREFLQQGGLHTD